MTREEVLNATELISNGFTEMMKAFWNNPELETPCKQQPCEDDAISRQAVIDGINEYFHDEYYQRTSIQDCMDCLIEDVIKDIQPVTPKPKIGHWIPVSEKPKEEGSYMTTLDYGEYGLAVGQRFYYGEDYGWTDGHVISWMPLPEPYKPQERKNR